MTKLTDKNFYSNIFITVVVISTHPHLDIVSGGVRQLLVEPWRNVEGAACVFRPTTSTIPQRISTIELSCIPCNDHLPQKILLHFPACKDSQLLPPPLRCLSANVQMCCLGFP